MADNYDDLLSEIWCGQLTRLPTDPPELESRADPTGHWVDGAWVVDVFGFLVHATHKRLAVRIHEARKAGAETIIIRISSSAGTCLGLSHGVLAIEDSLDAGVPVVAQILGPCCGPAYVLASRCILMVFDHDYSDHPVGVGQFANTWGNVWLEPPIGPVATLVSAIAQRQHDSTLIEIMERLVDDGTSSRDETANALNYLCGSNLNGVLL